ncbi:MAG TPA: hypothetical protein VEB59_04790, partial [Gemmatimonadales bacterium]|nr:hypothetical protein [Gemmatimonadales bacterium]
TSEEVPDLARDDRLLIPALAGRGIAARPAVWDDASVDWREFDAVVIRSCWDYHFKVERFEAWTRRLEADGVQLINPPAVLRWNARKTYLRDLAERGVPIVPTTFVDGPGPALDDLLREAGWDAAVVKPVVSASAHETWRARRGESADAERFARLADRMPLMVQPFVEEIAREGEWSLCFFGGRFSHAVLKRARPGDFRVQTDHGGTAALVPPGDRLVAEAAAALAAARAPTVYARVDGAVIGGALHLMELELLEPGLFLSLETAAAGRFADAIAGALSGAQE